MSSKLLKITTSNVGRPKPWTKAQQEEIDNSLPKWHEFSIVKHGDIDGHDARFIKWKKSETERLLKLDTFKVLPGDMTLAIARETIIRKFTNYRNAKKRSSETRLTETDLYDAMKQAASALVDLKTFSKGRSLFKKNHFPQITTLRDTIVRETPSISRVGAFQKAMKVLWDGADQEYWETRAVGESEDIFENQRNFGEHLYASTRSLCRVGGLGKLQMMVVYAFRDDLDHISSGIIEAHHDDDIPDFLSQDDFANLQRRYECWAVDVIPEKKKVYSEQNYVISRNSEGLPLFPNIDFVKESLEVIRKVTEGYLGYVWEFCRPGEGSIPWEVITANPTLYYDTKLYKFRVALPDALSSIESLMLADALSHVDLSAPFHFFQRNTSRPDSSSVGDPHDSSPTTLSPSPPTAGALPRSESSQQTCITHSSLAKDIIPSHTIEDSLVTTSPFFNIHLSATSPILSLSSVAPSHFTSLNTTSLLLNPPLDQTTTTNLLCPSPAADPQGVSQTAIPPLPTPESATITVPITLLSSTNYPSPSVTNPPPSLPISSAVPSINHDLSPGLIPASLGVNTSPAPSNITIAATSATSANLLPLPPLPVIDPMSKDLDSYPGVNQASRLRENNLSSSRQASGTIPLQVGTTNHNCDSLTFLSNSNTTSPPITLSSPQLSPLVVSDHLLNMSLGESNSGSSVSLAPLLIQGDPSDREAISKGRAKRGGRGSRDRSGGENNNKTAGRDTGPNAGAGGAGGTDKTSVSGRQTRSRPARAVPSTQAVLSVSANAEPTQPNARKRSAPQEVQLTDGRHGVIRRCLGYVGGAYFTPHRGNNRPEWIEDDMIVD